MPKSLNSVEILGKLVSFNTISERSNRALINFIQDYLKSYNIGSDVAWNKEGTKADLIATIGPMVEGGILLSGHTDVVPVSGQEWSSDPFKMIRNGDRLYGRGTCDMKGFLAVVLALISQFTKLDLKIPIHLAFSYDEELGCLGAPALISRLCMKIPRPRAAIIGEPTGMKLVNAHKGITLYETTIKGVSGHSSQVHLGVNANLYGAKYIKFLEEIARELVSAGHKDDRFEPPYSTISINMVEGGTAVNIIAEECKIVWDFRSVSSDDELFLLDKLNDSCVRDLELDMQKFSSNTSITTVKKVSVPALISEADNPAENLVRSLTGQNLAEVVAFASEAGLYQEAGIPSVICGPGSIDQAHRANEYIEISQLADCEQFLLQIGDWARRGGQI